MGTALDIGGFVLGAVVSLSTSWVLVSRLERLGERFGFSEASLGLVAALAADSPEITSAVTAVLRGQKTVGVGVVLGSNVFNLAALLGLGAVVAGRVGLHRRVLVFTGSVALWVAAMALATAVGAVSAPVALLLVLVVLVPYVVLTTRGGRKRFEQLLPRRFGDWIDVTVLEEEQELEDAIRPARGTALDAAAAAVSLVLVVAASILMERAGSSLGARFSLSQVVVGALLLATVTSLPNVVAAVYLASRQRGAATLSTALNSNTLNVIAGLLIPASLLGLPRAEFHGVIEGAWYLGLTVLTLGLAYRSRELNRRSGSLIIILYLVFVVVLAAA